MAIKILDSTDKANIGDVVRILHSGMDNHIEIYDPEDIKNSKEKHNYNNISSWVNLPSDDMTYFVHYSGSILDGVLVGNEGFRPVTQPEMVGSNIYWVVADEPGNGIGSIMINYFIERAKERNENFVTLGVQDGNPAKKLYERFNFVDAYKFGGCNFMVKYIDED